MVVKEIWQKLKPYKLNKILGNNNKIVKTIVLDPLRLDHNFQRKEEDQFIPFIQRITLQNIQKIMVVLMVVKEIK